MTPPKPENSPELTALLDEIKSSRGFDFSVYKLSTLTRRLRKRMSEVGVDEFGAYQDYLQVHPDEFERLFNTLLINVTAFFRDPEAWNQIRSDVIPSLLENKGAEESIRVWSVGCASGEEAYTLAILWAEYLGIEAFCERVKIFATDVDQEALIQARHATYQSNQLEALSPEQRQQFFTPLEGAYIFRRDMRRKLIFGRHDLVQDAPISKIDLLVCRNTLMYFNAEAQNRILSRFRFALNDCGYIFLGKAEMLLTHSDTFNAVNLKNRLFQKVPANTWQERLLVIRQNDAEERNHIVSRTVQLREAAFENGPQARIVLDPAGILLLINSKARELFNLSFQAIGRPLQDLEMSYRPVELRSRIDEAISQQRSIMLRDIRWQGVRSEILYLDIQVQPLLDTGRILGVSINCTDVTRYKQLRQELEHSKQELEVAYEELQSTNEELETTNEELQSSNEELETTNEELQSTNEELETMNEELQSTNEELQTVNDELHNTAAEVNRSNSFLQAILASLRRGVVVINRDLVIQIWNDQAEDLWGIRTDEAIGQHLLNLDIGLPLDELRQPIRECLSGAIDHINEFTLAAINRRGRQIQCRVTCTPLLGDPTKTGEPEMHGVILLMEDHALPSAAAAHESE